jgi:hypothetical protein
MQRVMMNLARFAEGRSRLRLFMLLGVVWATSHALTPVIGTFSSSGVATGLFAVALGIFAIGGFLLAAAPNGVWGVAGESASPPGSPRSRSSGRSPETRGARLRAHRFFLRQPGRIRRSCS